MEIFSKLSISILIALVKDFGKNSYVELQKNPKYLKILDEFGLASLKDNFANLYLFTLIRFTEKVSNPLFLDVFKHQNCVAAFEESNRNNTGNFEITLNHILHTDPAICSNQELKKINQIPIGDISLFKDIYNQLLNELKTPLQIEDSTKTNILLGKVKELENKIEALSKSENSGETFHVLQELIASYENSIFNDLNFIIPKELLIRLEKSLNTISLSENQRNKLLSQINYLEGWCLYLLNDPENQLKFIQAYELSPEIKAYREIGAISYYKRKLNDKAWALANEIVQSDSLNAKAYSVLKALDNLIQIPEIVAVQPSFKFYYIDLRRRSNNATDCIFELYNYEFINNIPLSPIINLEDFLYKYLLLSYYIEKIVNSPEKSSIFSLVKESDTFSKIDIFLESYNILLTFCKKSRDFNAVHYFSDANWIYYHWSFVKNPNNKSALDLYNAFQNISNTKDKFRYGCTLSALTQTKQYNLIELFSNKFTIPDKFFNIEIVYALSQKKSDPERCKELIIEYYDSIEKVNQDIIHYLHLALDLFKLLNEDPNELFLKHLNSKEYELDDIRTLLDLYSKTLCNITIDSSIEYLNRISDKIEIYNDSFKILLAIILQYVKELEKSNYVISRIKEYKTHPIPLGVYILNQIYLNERNEEMYELLSEYRKFRIDQTFLKYEIELYHLISDFQTGYDLSCLGCINFPESSYFIFYKIIALYNLDKDEELSTLLTKSLNNNFQFEWPNALSLARICSEKGKEELALEIAFKYTKNNFEIPKVRDFYFSFYLLCIKDVPPVKSNKVEVNSYVRFKLNNEIKVIHITKDLLKDKIYKHFKDRVNGAFNIFENFGDEGIIVEILEITDKYRGLFLEITEKIHREPYSGSQIMSFQIPEGDVGEINKVLIKKFGVNGSIEKQLRKDQIEAYKNLKISFSELVSRISRDKFFDIYYHLRNYERMFIVPPVYVFSSLDLKDSPTFVLDIPSVMAFNDLYEEIGLEFNEKFIISNYIKDYFKTLLKQSKIDLNSELSLDILENQVHITKNPKKLKEIRIKKIENIIKWVDKNCTIGHAKNKLEILQRLKETDDEIDSPFREYTLDTIFLANQNDHYLITDDLFFYTQFTGTIISIPSEFYYTKAFSDTSNIISKLIEFNYVGLSLSSTQLIIEYDKSITLKSDSTFMKAIRSLDFLYSRTKNNFDCAIAFIKYIYSLSMGRSIKKRISQMVLQSVLENYPFEINDTKRFYKNIKNEFYLMGNCDLEVLDDLVIVMKILNISGQ